MAAGQSSKENLLPFLRTVTLLAELDDRELLHFSQDLHRKTFEAGETLFYQGDLGQGVYIVELGTVRIYVHGDEGQEVSMVIYGPGDLFGEMSRIDQKPRSATAVAVEKTDLWIMAGQDFDQHLRSSPQLALNVMLMLSTRLRRANESVMSLASLDVTRRIVKRLLSLALRRGVRVEAKEAGIIRITSKLTQGDLASLIGASRESTNRALRALQRKGLITVGEDGHIVLLQTNELSKLVGSDETWW